ncbi:hypothetical protein LP420_02345 [Massilia sp. B-10]|nr:hypothetical protein LP420_02345 [Massilia sp. B-10]
MRLPGQLGRDQLAQFLVQQGRDGITDLAKVGQLGDPARLANGHSSSVRWPTCWASRQQRRHIESGIEAVEVDDQQRGLLLRQQQA